MIWYRFFSHCFEACAWHFIVEETNRLIILMAKIKHEFEWCHNTATPRIEIPTKSIREYLIGILIKS